MSYEGLGWPWQQLCESVDAIMNLSGTWQPSSHPSYLFSSAGREHYQQVFFLHCPGLGGQTAARGGCAGHHGEVVLKAPEEGANQHEVKQLQQGY